MPRIKIEDRTIKRAKQEAAATGRRIEIPDAIVLGLRLRVTPSGEVSFSVITRIKGGDGRQIRLTYRQWETVADVRERARMDLEKAERGIDPRPGRRGHNTPITFADLYELWLERYAKVELKAWKSRDQRARALVLPVIGHLRIDDLVRDRRPITRMVWGIADRGLISSAIQALSMTSGVFTWAQRRDEVASNPCLGIAYPEAPQGHRRALDQETMRRLFQRFLADAQADPWTGRGLPGSVHHLGMIMLTRMLLGQRTEEVVNMRWQDLDIEGGWWTMPDRFRLAGREVHYTKNGKPHRVPLLGLWKEKVWPLLEAARTHGVWVFPSPRREGQPIQAHSVPFYSRRVAAGEGVEFTAKDFRTTFVTTLRELRVTKETAQRLVNHTQGETIDAHYDLYDYDAEKVEAMRTYDAHCRRVLLGEEARVLPLARSSRKRGHSPR